MKKIGSFTRAQVDPATGGVHAPISDDENISPTVVNANEAESGVQSAKDGLSKAEPPGTKDEVSARGLKRLSPFRPSAAASAAPAADTAAPAVEATSTAAPAVEATSAPARATTPRKRVTEFTPSPRGLRRITTSFRAASLKTSVENGSADCTDGKVDVPTDEPSMSEAATTAPASETCADQAPVKCVDENAPCADGSSETEATTAPVAEATTPAVETSTPTSRPSKFVGKVSTLATRGFAHVSKKYASSRPVSSSPSVADDKTPVKCVDEKVGVPCADGSSETEATTVAPVAEATTPAVETSTPTSRPSKFVGKVSTFATRGFAELSKKYASSKPVSSSPSVVADKAPVKCVDENAGAPAASPKSHDEQSPQEASKTVAPRTHAIFRATGYVKQ